MRGCCKLAVELCAHDFDSGRASATREMPSKEVQTRRTIAQERDGEQRHMISQKSSSFQELQACTLRFSAWLLPDSCDADEVTPPKSDPKIYSFFTVWLTFGACRVKTSKSFFYNWNMSVYFLFDI